MSKYTCELRWIMEEATGSSAPDEEKWRECWETIGLDDYPIFDEKHRDELNSKIVRTYYFREIGFETVALFRWYMRQTMHNIMPYYNQLYESENLIDNPFSTKDLSYSEKWTRDESTNRNTQNDSVNSSHTENANENVFQDTPMNTLASGAVAAKDYATDVTLDNGTTDTNANSTAKSKADYTGDYEGTKIHTQAGRDGNQSELLQNYRDTFLNIDYEIVKRVGNLFLQIW